MGVFNCTHTGLTRKFMAAKVDYCPVCGRYSLFCFTPASVDKLLVSTEVPGDQPEFFQLNPSFGGGRLRKLLKFESTPTVDQILDRSNEIVKMVKKSRFNEVLMDVPEFMTVKLDIEFRRAGITPYVLQLWI